MKKSFISFVFTLLFISCGNSQEIKSITTLELKSILDKNKIQLLDVRTQNEIKQGYIESALFSDFYSNDFYVNTIQQLDKNKPVYIYCRTGRKSLITSKKLQENGYKVVNVLGGYTQWKQENQEK